MNAVSTTDGLRGPRALLGRTTLQRLNAELCLAGLERREGRAHHRPMHVALQVASHCNLECYMCLERTRPEEHGEAARLKSLPLRFFDVLAREVFPFSSRVSFGIGGEPTLAENFELFLERAHAAGQEIELITNATRFHAGTLAATIARCVGYLQISLEGATRETYERVRIGATFDRLIANLELLNRERERYRVGERTHVSFWVTLLKSSVNELPLLIELAHRLHVDRVHAHHATPITPEGAADSLADDPGLWNHWRAIASARAAELGIEIDLPEALAVPDRPSAPASAAPPEVLAPVVESRDESRKHDLRYSRLTTHAVQCHLPSSAIYVLWDGRVVPCCYPYAQEKMTMGSLAHQSFAEIWNGPPYRALRLGLASGHVIDVCKHCPVVHDVPLDAPTEALIRASPDWDTWLREHGFPEPLPGAEEPDLLARLAASSAVSELDLLRKHARDLEAERPHLHGHIANLEAERPHLLGHIANLERELGRKS